MGIALGVLLAAGCRRHDAPPPAGHATSRHAAGSTAGSSAAAESGVAGDAAAAAAAAEAALRNTVPLRQAAQFRGLRSYDQAMPGRWAVCGQVSPFADDPGLFVAFVAVVTVGADGRAQAPDLLFSGTTVDDADRTYAALITHCYERGGPGVDPVRSVPPLPPLPNTVPTPPPPGAVSSSASVPGNVAAGGGTAAGAGGEAVTRQNVNLHADPHGAVTRVVPQGTALHVFATAPGGWLQVGDAAPWGWIHESMLERR